MKKFKEGEIFYNVIKAHPKVEFFINNGQVKYNRQNNPGGSSNLRNEDIALFDLINPTYVGPSSSEIEPEPPVADGVFLLENGDFLMTEDDNNLALES